MDELKSDITEVKIVDPVETEKVVEIAENVEEKSDTSSDQVSAENVDLVYKTPPRYFRSSLIHKTKELFVSKKFRDDDGDDENRPIRANITWFVIMGIGSLLAFSIIDKAWQRFQGNPMITNLILNDRDKTVIYPSVAVCPNNAADSERIYQLMMNFGIYKNNNKSQEIQEFLAAIPNFSYKMDDLKYVILSSHAKKQLKEITDIDLRTLAFDLSVSCDQIFKAKTCKFRNKPFDCCESFMPVYTERGFCYSFNTRLYGKSFDEKINHDISFIFDNDYSYDLKFGTVRNAEVILHSFEESVTAGHHVSFPTKPDVRALATIAMQETVSDVTVHKLRLKQRKCHFKGEIKFKYYKDEEYSYSTCMKECRINRALEVCGCLPPVYQTEYMKNLTKCDFESLKCLKDQSIVDDSKCKCLLPCEFTAISFENIKMKSYPNLTNSDITISLKQFPIVSFQREVKFGFIDFLVAFGSILALFLSFSFLSLIELLLYLLRMCTSNASAKVEKN